MALILQILLSLYCHSHDGILWIEWNILTINMTMSKIKLQNTQTDILWFLYHDTNCLNHSAFILVQCNYIHEPVMLPICGWSIANTLL